MPEFNDETSASYRISELSRLTGVKAGTIRFYEKCGFIGSVERSSNGYRIYRRRHIVQLRICRLVFGGFVNKRLRRESLKVLDASARWDLDAYEKACADYQKAIKEDIDRTRKAINLCMEQMRREDSADVLYSKKEAAAMIGVTPEAVRNWERNGLLGLHTPYQRRFYDQTSLNRMYVIRLLLDTGYSMMAVRSFMLEHDGGQPEKAEQLLMSPMESEELRYRSDRHLEALLQLREKALQLRELKAEMDIL